MDIFGMQLSGAAIFWLVVLILALILGVALRERLAKRFEALRTYLGEVGHEMTKVTWPSRDEVVNSTVLVILVVFVVTLVVMAIDGVLGRIVGLLFMRGQA